MKILKLSGNNTNSKSNKKRVKYDLRFSKTTNKFTLGKNFFNESGVNENRGISFIEDEGKLVLAVHTEEESHLLRGRKGAAAKSTMFYNKRAYEFITSALGVKDLGDIFWKAVNISDQKEVQEFISESGLTNVTVYELKILNRDTTKQEEVVDKVTPKKEKVNVEEEVEEVEEDMVVNDDDDEDEEEIDEFSEFL